MRATLHYAGLDLSFVQRSYRCATAWLPSSTYRPFVLGVMFHCITNITLVLSTLSFVKQFIDSKAWSSCYDLGAWTAGNWFFCESGPHNTRYARSQSRALSLPCMHGLYLIEVHPQLHKSALFPYPTCRGVSNITPLPNWIMKCLWVHRIVRSIVRLRGMKPMSQCCEQRRMESHGVRWKQLHPTCFPLFSINGSEMLRRTSLRLRFLIRENPLILSVIKIMVDMSGSPQHVFAKPRYGSVACGSSFFFDQLS